MSTATADSILSVEGLTRDFGPVRALDDVSLSFRRGEVHGIIGENGAGKSTLMKIISGLYQPTAGRMVYRGEPVSVNDPAHALEMGIAMVHQELNLVDELSVADNVYLGREITRAGLVNRSETRRRALEHLSRLGARIDPAARLGDLSIAQQQMVEIAKALSCDASVVIMDEPTAVLAKPEAEKLFALVRGLSERSVTVLYISHRLEEVLRICDRITVLRDGELVCTLEREGLGEGDVAEAKLASHMVGRRLEDHFPPISEPGAETMLSVAGLSVPGRVEDVSFEARAGEILGFAGLVGAGRTETAEAVAGLRRRSAGRVLVEGRPVPVDDPRAAVRRGVAYLPEDRRGRGLIMGRSVVENTTIASLDRYANPLLSKEREREATRRHVDRLQVKLGGVEDPIGTLSGGNQQKIALAKWLETEPRVLLLDEPTRGLDIGAKEEIYRLVSELAHGGMACVFISSELNELLGMCHRIAVMRHGRLVAVVPRDEMNDEVIMRYAAGVERENGENE